MRSILARRICKACLATFLAQMEQTQILILIDSHELLCNLSHKCSETCLERLPRKTDTQFKELISTNKKYTFHTQRKRKTFPVLQIEQLCSSLGGAEPRFRHSLVYIMMSSSLIYHADKSVHKVYCIFSKMLKDIGRTNFM